MPRKARIDAPGVLQHVIIRGIERRKIFVTDEDRQDFIHRLDRILSHNQTSCYAWVFMANHAHFLFRTGPVPLTVVMRRLLTGYAILFNRRHKRTGQLFQNRYKSVVCQEEPYFKELVRYIHLNPVRARLVSNITELAAFPFSGHGALMGAVKQPWQNVDFVLKRFGKTLQSGRKAYLRYMEKGVGQGHRDELTGGGLIRSVGGWSEAKRLRRRAKGHVMSDERILGDPDFVSSLLSKTGEKYAPHYEMKLKGYDLDKVAERVADIFQMDSSEIFSKGKQKKKVAARSLLCFWAVHELGMSLKELAARLGYSSPGIGFSVERGEAIAREKNYRLIPSPEDRE